jgi:hypothetical protein
MFFVNSLSLWDRANQLKTKLENFPSARKDAWCAPTGTTYLVGGEREHALGRCTRGAWHAGARLRTHKNHASARALHGACMVLVRTQPCWLVPAALFGVLFLALFRQLTCSVVAGKQRYTKKGTRG